MFKSDKKHSGKSYFFLPFKHFTKDVNEDDEFIEEAIDYKLTDSQRQRLRTCERYQQLRIYHKGVERDNENGPSWPFHLIMASQRQSFLQRHPKLSHQHKELLKDLVQRARKRSEPGMESAMNSDHGSKPSSICSVNTLQNHCRYENEVVFFDALKTKDWTEVYDLLDNCDVPVDIADPNDDGNTALHKACMGNNVALVRGLLDRNANVNIRNFSKGWTPLHIACHYGLFDITKLLLSVKGVNLDIADYEDKKPLDVTKFDSIVELFNEM
jgi:hypothetical protein